MSEASDLRERVSASFEGQGLMMTLGASLESVADGEVIIRLPFSREISQQHGYVHAGAVTSVVDSACGYAALTRAPAEQEVVTVEFKVNLVRPAIGDHFIALGQVENAGRRLAVCRGELRAFKQDNQDYKVVALMQATIAFVS